jgi:uncharacterized phiE125 gp8 family phage protein
MLLRVESQPSLEPVTVDEVKSVLRLTSSADDADIAGYIVAAREIGERITRQSLIYKGYAAYYDSFPSPGKPLIVPAPPLIAVDTILYLDSGGNQQTWDASEYIVGLHNWPGVVQEKAPNIYPVVTAGHIAGAVEVHFHAGYAYGGYGDDTVTIPEQIRLAIRRLAAHFYDHPESTSTEAQNEVPEGYLSIFRAHRVF